MKLIGTLLFAALGLSASHALAQDNHTEERKGRVVFSEKKVSRSKDTLRVSVIAQLEKLKLSSREAVTLTPMLLSTDGSRRFAFPTTIIGGKNKRIMNERKKIGAKKDKIVQRFVPYHAGEEQNLRFNFAVPYAPWMGSAKFVVEEVLAGCADCPKEKNLYVLQQKVVQDPYKPTFRFAYVVPPIELVKMRSDKFTAYFNFHVNKYDLLPNLGNNRRELARVDSITRYIMGNPDVQVRNVTVDGYASPEGYFAANQTLSENRSEAFMKYMRERYRIETSMFTVNGHGEDWEGLRAEVQKRNVPSQSEILKVLDVYTNDQDRKRELVKINNGHTYRYLLDNIYPSLRRTEYKFSYEVRPYTFEEAKQRLKTHPQFLSLGEMHQVAFSYPEGSAERREALATAERFFANDPHMRLNSAVWRLEQMPGAVDPAQFKNMATSPEFYNALGVAYAQKRNYEKALECFRMAGNLPEAQHNAEEVRKVLEE